MSNGPLDWIRSIVIGIVMPLVIACLAVPYITGSETHTRWGTLLTRDQAFGKGLFLLGMAVAIHAICFKAYENHQVLKYSVLIFGLLFLFLGAWVEFS